MAGFEEFINLLKDASSGKLNSTNSLSAISDKINAAVNAQKVAQNNVSSSPKSKTPGTKKKKKVDKSESEKQTIMNEQKRTASYDVIMKNSSSNNGQLNQSLYDLSNFDLGTTPDDMIQGIIYSEILNRPLSKRRGVRRQRRNW